MNRILFFLFFVLFCFCTKATYAQNGEKVYRFLNLPTSTHINALGGNNVSLVDNDISLVFHNPALLGDEMNMNFNVNYMSYIGDIGSGSAIFGKAIDEISNFAVGMNYIDYGKFNKMSPDQVYEGTFSAKDISVNGVYSRDLTAYLRGGVTAKLIYSGYDAFSSFAVGFDVGLSYYSFDNSFSAGIALKNVGAQLSSYNDERVSLPWDVQVGLTKKIKNAPLRVSVTGIYLTQWEFERIDEANVIPRSKDNFFGTFFKHIVFGVDILPSDNMWLAVGFSPKANSDMRLLDSNKWGGWNFGAGMRVKRFNIGFSLAQLHPSATSYHFGFSMDLSKM